ncbi:thrombospondin-3 [Manacus vitellinus]|uniref:thrombospondin-3 n=1 Tax=Manacus vitellinus TaxID=328815 RepID=UPI00115EFE9F|nr:thrombospondin-3 [Manacus vitellinus]
MASVAHKIRMELLTVNDVYLLSTFRLPPKQGGTLFGLYSKKDNTRWLEVSVVGKINKVLVRYLREDNKVHSVNLQHAHVADGQSHSIIVRLSGLRRDTLSVELYVDCKQMDSSVGLPELSEIPLAEVEAIEVRTGQKAYQRMQGFVESMKLILGGSMSRVGALSECPFQGDESIHSAVTSVLASILGEQTKALVTQLTLFNRVLSELREDIRDQVKEMSLIRNTIMECQVCGFHEQRSRCNPNPCFSGVDCMETYEYPGYRCGPCPPGLEGNGTHCTDIEECAHANPCFPGSKCINTSPGFRCEPCPRGYRGNTVSGVGVDYAKASKQVCTDIDECNDGNNGGCDPNSICTNTLGSFKCGPCKSGFAGNQTSGCVPQKSCSTTTTNPCDINGFCLFERNGEISCACNVGWAGNGNVCGPDTDLDGYPDEPLPCIDNNKHCKQDNCRLTPNSGQEDADNDGIGDQCDDDADGDGVKNVEDNCRLFPNKDQQNSDTDSFGDACDNCPNVPNNDQRDTDSNGEGDACDNDIDGDGIPNMLDNCPKVPNPLQTDRDEDGVGDACDSCPEMSNPTQCRRLLRHPLRTCPGAACAGPQPGQAGTCAVPTETTVEMETAETTATEMTTETTTRTLTAAPPVFTKSTGGSRSPPALFPHATVFPGKNTTDFQSGNHSLGNGTALLARVPLSFRIINRSFNESLRDPTSEQYRSLSRTVLSMFEHVFGCAGCAGTQTYMGCSELRYSQGSVEVQSTLVFGNGSDTVTPNAAEQRLRKSLDQNGFIMGLQLDSIQSSTEVTSPAPVPVVPDWAIALLVLVSILVLLSLFTCLLLMSSCTCRRKSRGKLDLLSQKDSYHPMAEYLQYQSHGRYVSPNSKPNPYSQLGQSLSLLNPGSPGVGAGGVTVPPVPVSLWV